MASATLNYNLPYPTPTDPVDFTGDFQALAEALDSAITGIGEISQDAVALMITSASHTNGISAVYNDANNKLTFSLAQNIATSGSPTFGSITLNGTPTAPTAAVDTNTTQIATTAYVINQGYVKDSSASSTYLTQSSASTNYLTKSSASTTYAPLASHALTGVPTSTTASVNTNTTQIATTAFVLGQANSTSGTIAMDGTQAAGSSNLYARADHVHPTDTSRAPLASPALTGIPTSTTASVDTNTTQIATTAFVINQGYLKSSSASSTYLTQTTASTTYALVEDFIVLEVAKDGTGITNSSQYTFRAPFAMTITQIPRAFLSVASSSGSVSMDITKNASSIFTTTLSIDQSEKTSYTAAIPAVLGTTSIANDDEIIVDVVDAGTGAEGLKVIMYYKRT